MKHRSRIWVVLTAFLLCLCSLLLLWGCSKAKEKVESLYKPTNIQYDGIRISWTKVTLADYYTVQINDGEQERVNTSLYAYDNVDHVEFDVTVYAWIGDKSYSETKTFIPLDTITSISVAEDGTLNWEPVPEADAYLVELNGTVLEDTLSDTSYTPEAGANRIRIRPTVLEDDRYYALWSAEQNINKLSAPASLSYDGEKLTWVGNAAKYALIIGGSTQTVNGTSYAYDAGNQSFDVELRAVGDHTTSYDSQAVCETFRFLEPAKNLSVEDGILYWSEVENAEGYEVRVNGSVQKKTVATAAYDQLPAGAALTVEVKPFNSSGKYFSVWSETKNVHLLETPVVSWNSDLELDGEANNNFIWNSVNGAAGYTVELTHDGTATRTEYGAGQMAFAHAYAEVGVYTVRVKAVPSKDSDLSDSRYSTVLTVERLAAPQAALK